MYSAEFVLAVSFRLLQLTGAAPKQEPLKGEFLFPHFQELLSTWAG